MKAQMNIINGEQFLRELLVHFCDLQIRKGNAGQIQHLLHSDLNLVGERCEGKEERDPLFTCNCALRDVCS
jgi:hypothetical protein